MRILVASDTHGKNDNLRVALERTWPIDLLVHLGDFGGSGDEIADLAGCRVEMVAGNTDYYSSLPREKEIELSGHRALITHGHYYYVEAGMSDIEKAARGRGCDIAMFGHTHRPIIDFADGVTALNPGSLSYPRQEGKRPSYAVVEIDRRGKAHFELCYL